MKEFGYARLIPLSFWNYKKEIIFRVYETYVETNTLQSHSTSAGICTVINLQLPWEHAKCGPGLERSGFTYEPEDLMRQGGRYPLSNNHPPSVHSPSLPPPHPPPQFISIYNYGWLDYGVPTLESILDMVKVVDFALRGGKVAIHCHAGLGRTGVLIACYLVYSQRMSGDEAIRLVRSNRCVVVRRPIVAVHTPSLHIHHYHL